MGKIYIELEKFSNVLFALEKISNENTWNAYDTLVTILVCVLNSICHRSKIKMGLILCCVKTKEMFQGFQG